MSVFRLGYVVSRNRSILKNEVKRACGEAFVTSFELLFKRLPQRDEKNNEKSYRG
jgi:hypothetical protein